MAIFKDNNVFVGKETQGKKVGTYEIINVSESPIKITIFTIGFIMMLYSYRTECIRETFTDSQVHPS